MDGQNTGSDPETGFEEINSDVREADLQVPLPGDRISSFAEG
jgi:hypothetical protein